MKRVSPWSQVSFLGIVVLSLFLLRSEVRLGVAVLEKEQRNVENNSDLSSSDTEKRSNETEEAKTFPRLCRDAPEASPIWEWKYGNGTNAQRAAKKRMLIATYSAFGTYAKLLEMTAPVNKAYAKQWGHDIVILQGTTMILPWDENCTPTEERSRFNKIDLLLTALRHEEYDLLLLLDADTLVYNFSYDISAMIDDDTMLVAQRTKLEDPPATLNINNGVTLWNLRHPITTVVAKDWDRRCRKGIPDNRPFRGDQFYLRESLKREERIEAVAAVWDEFYYRDGTVVKHFQRSNSRSWNETGLDLREERIENATEALLRRHQLREKDLEVKQYVLNSGDAL